MSENSGLAESFNDGYRSIDERTKQNNNGVEGGITTQQQEQQEQQQDVGSGTEELAGSGPPKMSRKGKFILVLCAASMFLAACGYSLLGPFYTLEAQRKGMSVFLVGIVFGGYELVIVLTSPIFGNFLTTIGSKFTFLAGIFVAGSCNILFGTLIYIEHRVAFSVMSIACRCVEAAGFSAYSTASFAIASTYNPNHIGLAFAVLETGIGAGFVFGPVLGGSLYTLGGFGLPFYVVGVLVLLNGLIVCKLLPSTKDVETERPKDSMFTLLRSPTVVVCLFSVFTVMLGLAAFHALFAKHLEQFALSPFFIGLFFALVSLLLAISACIIGYVTDRRKNLAPPLMVGGHLVSAVGYFLLGPSGGLVPLIPFTMWTVGVSLVLIGASLPPVSVSTMQFMTVGALKLGLKDDLGTYAMVSGLYLPALHSGWFCGPVVGSAIAQLHDNPTSFTVVGLLNVALVLYVMAFIVVGHCRRRYKHWAKMCN